MRHVGMRINVVTRIRLAIIYYKKIFFLEIVNLELITIYIIFVPTKREIERVVYRYTQKYMYDDPFFPKIKRKIRNTPKFFNPFVTRANLPNQEAKDPARLFLCLTLD